MSDAPILEARGLVRHYDVDRGFWRAGSGRQVRAVDGVDLAVRKGETLAIVGESGCGKSTLARLLLRLERPTAGTVRYAGRDLASLSEAEMRPLRAKLQLVFQDPFASLNPRMSVRTIVEEPLVVHGLGSAAERRRRAEEIAAVVGLRPDQLDRWPHEFSGGQRQRIGIARALVSGPDLVVGDEPVSALDVSVRAQVVNLLQDLKATLGLTLVVISHDLAVVRHMADRVGVMYLGKLVELAPTADLFARPAHPYTRALLAAVPRPDPTAKASRPILEGDVPSPVDPPSGCRFRTRCPFAVARCAEVLPPLDEIAAAHHVACIRASEIPAEPVLAGGAPSAALDRRLELFAAARAGMGRP